MIDRSADEQRKHEWGVILAGGDGTRLKSLSRRITGDERPKQFCPVLSDMSLVKETQISVALELPKERTLFLVNRLHQPYYSDILSDIAASNLIEQPRNIGTAPAILYSLLKIAVADPQAFVAFIPSDHYVSDNTKFMAHIRRAFEAAPERPNLVILLGVEPERPEVEYGWIEPAQAIQEHSQLHRVRSRGQCLSLARMKNLWRMKKFYALLGEINFSDRVLALVPERLTVLKVSGVKWNDLGEPKRVIASIQTAGARPLWIEKY
jgi:hypothetical protein